MKWILSLLTICAISSCTTKPYMVGSVNDMFYKRHRTPGERFWSFGSHSEADYDYSWQARLYNTAHIPVVYKPVRERVVMQETVDTYAPPPVTYSK